MTPSNMRIGIALLVLLSCDPAVTSLVAAPTADTIELGMIKLTLGMTQQRTLDLLGDRFKVDKMQSAAGGPYSSWLIQSHGPPFTMIGNVAFKDGKLISVIKEWGPDDQQRGVELAIALYGAIAQFIKEGRRSCVIDAGTNQPPQAEIKTAFIVCGGKYLDVTITKTSRLESASVTEHLESPK